MQNRIKKQKANVGGDEAYWQEVLVEVKDRAQANRNFEANRNNPSDLSARLALDTIIDEIVPHLDTADMVNTKKVSHGWRHLFASEPAIEKHWRLEFAKNFAFDMTLLRKALDSEIVTGDQIRQLYKNFTELLNAYHPKMPNYIQHMLQDSDSHKLLLFCAAGNNKALLENIEEDVYPMWFELACYTNNVNLAATLYRGMVDNNGEIDHRYRYYLGIADLFSSTELVDKLLNINLGLNAHGYLTTAEEDKQIEPYTAVEKCHPRFTASIIKKLESKEIKSSQELYSNAVKAGNYQLVKYLVKKHKMQLTISLETMNDAAASGNVLLLDKLLLAGNRLGIAPDRSTLRCAAESGSIACTNLLITNYNMHIQTDVLQAALTSGNIPLVNHLVQSNPAVDQALNQPALLLAANHSNNKSLSEYYYPCYDNILEILPREQDGEADVEFIHNQLSIAYQIAPTFFKQIITNILHQHEEYFLTDSEVAAIESSPAYKDAFGNESEEELEQNNQHNLR